MVWLANARKVRRSEPTHSLYDQTLISFVVSLPHIFSILVTFSWSTIKQMGTTNIYGFATWMKIKVRFGG